MTEFQIAGTLADLVKGAGVARNEPGHGQLREHSTRPQIADAAQAGGAQPDGTYRYRSPRCRPLRARNPSRPRPRRSPARCCSQDLAWRRRPTSTPGGMPPLLPPRHRRAQELPARPQIRRLPLLQARALHETQARSDFDRWSENFTFNWSVTSRRLPRGSAPPHGLRLRPPQSLCPDARRSTVAAGKTQRATTLFPRAAYRRALTLAAPE